MDRTEELKLKSLPNGEEQNKALATTPTDELLALPFLQADKITDALHAYQLSKRGNSSRVTAKAVRWGKRGARVNTISPGIIITPLAKDELNGPRGDDYRKMISVSAVGRAGTLDEVATVAALQMGQDGAFITGSDFLIDGEVTFAYWYGELAPKKIIIILRSAEANIPTVRPDRCKQLSLLCIRKLNNQYVCL